MTLTYTAMRRYQFLVCLKWYSNCQVLRREGSVKARRIIGLFVGLDAVPFVLSIHLYISLSGLLERRVLALCYGNDCDFFQADRFYDVEPHGIV